MLESELTLVRVDCGCCSGLSSTSVLFLMFLTRSWKARSTLIPCLAEVSKNSQLNCLASFSPSSKLMDLSSSKSDLFPTNKRGTESVSLTLRICW
ncbi:hypothetical protein WICPIJ_004348 [Wickerhamomyces pijperi]|uniref:Uncharacterized protein n=1 Tax=Wickerhamomyces pijperi TaxID=599730 RepID=A0A9P8Q5T5_WICPI|nr:hypothetical protein WICPIJ_004348 [Wickerhamomyces pijperi]